ncbi:uncharacterized protein LOC129582548 [Paramacrobiotus metropolitanus]|uniref:uncharacterized protein LOC129582548 n=1 Tax=Paramacrobiotus metropolitanus TaxID=2943436 RepID=UPI00244613A7|nr:uncharacterized protein LOC129582548 [Paramacrobiotus metropolitanus]
MLSISFFTGKLFTNSLCFRKPVTGIFSRRFCLRFLLEKYYSGSAILLTREDVDRGLELMFLERKMPKKTVQTTSILKPVGTYYRGQLATLHVADYTSNGQKMHVIAKQSKYTEEFDLGVAKMFCDIREEKWQPLYALKHSNVVRYFDGFFKHMLVPEDSAPQALLIMEFFPGGDLHRLLHTADLPRTLCLDYLKQILLGLEYLHANRLKHLHIQPRKLLLDDADSVGTYRTIKIAGLDESVMLDTQHPQSLATLREAVRYMSPEVAQFLSSTDSQNAATDEFPVQGVSTRSDVYSVGVIFLDMAFYTGKTVLVRNKTRPLQKRQLAVDDETDAETVVKFLVEGGYPEVHYTASAVYRDFAERCCMRSAKQRPTAADLLAHPIFAAAARRVNEYLI